MADEVQGGVDQHYGQQFFENYQLVDDSGNAITEPAPAQQQQPAQPGQPGQQQAAAPSDGTQPGQAQPQAGQQQATPAPQPGQAQPQATPLDGIFYKNDDKGNRTFDAAAAMDFLKPVQVQAQAQQQAQQFPAQQVQPQQAPAQAQGAQQQAQAAQQPTFEDSVREKMLMAHRTIGDLVKQGYSYEHAVNISQQQIEQYLDREFLERRLLAEIDKRSKGLTDQQKAIEAQREVVELTPRSTNNLLAVSQRYAQNMPPDKFRSLLFDQKYGGEFVNRMFDLQNPDKKGLQGDQLRGAMNDWFVRFSADAGNLEMLAMVTQAAIQRDMMPSIIEHVRGLERGQQQQRRDGYQRAQNGQFATPKPQSGTTGFPDLDRYLYGNGTS